MRIALILALLALAACESGIPFVRKYEPVQRPVTAVCVEINERVIVRGFHEGLMRALQANGIAARDYAGPQAPADCPVTMAYVARSSWDRVRYLGLFETTVFEGGTRIGWMSYNARNAGKDQAKYDPPQRTLTPMVAQLFPNR